MAKLFKIVTIIAVCGLFLKPSTANANKTKEILLTASYGIVAGTVIGVASLAFSRNPGGKLRNIAVGASLGLYTGIALGAYLAYGVVLEEEVEEKRSEDDEFFDEEEDEDDEEASLDMRFLVPIPTIIKDRKNNNTRVEFPLLLAYF